MRQTKLTRDSFHVFQANARNALKQSEQVPSVLICAGTGCIAGGAMKIYENIKAECESRDLIVEYDRANGYAHTSPTDAFKAKLAEAGVDLSVRFARVMPKAKAKAEREKAHRYVCPVCGQEVRTTSELSLICGHCNVNMDRLD